MAEMGGRRVIVIVGAGRQGMGFTTCELPPFGTDGKGKLIANFLVTSHTAECSRKPRHWNSSVCKGSFGHTARKIRQARKIVE